MTTIDEAKPTQHKPKKIIWVEFGIPNSGLVPIIAQATQKIVMPRKMTVLLELHLR